MSFNDTKKIKKMEEKFNCPYCRDLGMIFVENKELVLHGRPVVNDASRPCICTLNGMVSRKYPHLKAVPYIRGEDCISVGKKIGFSNCVFFGDEYKLRHIVKAFVILHYHYNRTFTVLTGADIAEKFVMQQPDGFVPTVSPLTDIDLVVLLCVSTINNRGIAPSCYEMVSNRRRSNKATWIFAEDSGKLTSSKENQHADFNDKMETLLTDFKHVNIEEKFSGLKFDKEFKDKSQMSQAISTQDVAGAY